MIQIDFYDRCVIDTLVPIKTMKPEVVYFFIDKQYYRQFDDPEFMRKTILGWGFVKQVLFVEVDIHNYQEIKSKINYLIRTTDDTEIVIDLTGGNELLIAGGFEFHNRENVNVILTDISKEVIYNIATYEVIAQVEHITIEDYVSAIGALKLNYSRTTPDEESFHRICSLAEVLLDNTEEWHALHYYIVHNYSRTSMNITIPRNISTATGECQTDYLLNNFCRCGYLQKGQGRQYRFCSDEAKQYLLDYGVWLELYVYAKLKAVFDDVYLGVRLDWDRQDNRDAADNEIDIILLYKSTPVFISCKMCKPIVTHLYEVSCLAGKFGGKNARAFIATSYNADPFLEEDSGILHKFDVLNVGMIPASVFAADDYGDRIKKMINL